jgi:hypothetical protein
MFAMKGEMRRSQASGRAFDCGFYVTGAGQVRFFAYTMKPSRKRLVSGLVWRGASGISLGNN